MKPYGQKHPSKICQCMYCGKKPKAAIKRRARKDAKEEIKNEQFQLNVERGKARER